MSFFSHIFRTIRRTITRPIRTIAKVIHNPTSAILNRHIRSSKAFKNIGRPIIKIGTGIVLGSVTGGVGLAAGGLAFGGLSAAGAVAGGLASAASGGLTSKAFQPVNNVVIPASSGLLAGNLSKLTAVKNFSRGIKLVKTGLKIEKTIKGVRTRKALIADMQKRAEAARMIDGQVIALANSQAELSLLKNSKNGALKVINKKAGFDSGGAIIGATTGALVAGPAGAAIGGIIGGVTARRKK